MSSKTIYEQLLAIAEQNPNLLVAYKTDLTVQDRKTLSATRAEDRLVWMLRECGTQLNFLPEYLYFKEDNISEEERQKRQERLQFNYDWFRLTAEGQRERSNSPLFFLITCTDCDRGEVKKITESEALTLLKPKTLVESSQG